MRMRRLPGACSGDSALLVVLLSVLAKALILTQLFRYEKLHINIFG
jgi:hypothetical protein